MKSEIFMNLDGEIFVMNWNSMPRRQRLALRIVISFCGAESLGEL